MKRLLACALALVVAAPLTAFAQAPSWPTKPVKLVVPFPAGGGTDAFARPLAAFLSQALGQQFFIDNRGGAGGTIGADIVAKSPPDGYTFLVGAVHHAIAVSVYRQLPYSLEKDLMPVTLLSIVPNVVVLNPKWSQINSVKELIDYAKANPDKLNYGSAGNGTSHHLAPELFKSMTGVKMNHVPYKGAGPAMQDLIAGQVDIMFDGLGSSAAHIKGGRIKAIAVGSDKRAPGFADVPTVKEAGGPDYQVATWYGLWAPKGTPQAIVDQMQAELRKALGSDEIKATWASLGANPPNLWGANFGRFVGSEIKRWSEVVKNSGAKLD